ncbi:MAG: hypothetical protein NC310_02030 [Roseburia sp.]|nr:hypothetical protein [Roseburia sp.]MCM1556304.1 hypothetical protein [Anaeroplasma bactoclasticum]
MCFKKKEKKPKVKEKRDKKLLLPNDEFSIYKNDKKVYLDKTGKIRQDINYTLIPKEKTETSKVKVVILSIVLGLFIFASLIFMAFAYEIDFKKAIFEFANNYLFLGAITLFVFLVFKSKK